MKKILLIAITLTVTGCLTMSGNYTVTGYDANGKELMGNLKLTAHGRGIYSVRNAFCSARPNATVIIKDSITGEELKSESPYQCPKSKSKNTDDIPSNAGDISSNKSTQPAPNNTISATHGNTNQPSQSIYESTDEIKKELATNNNGTSDGRIRLFGQNGTRVILYRNSKCAKDSLGKEDERVSGGLTSAFSSLIGTASNISIGIPETETTRKLKKKDGLLSKAYFREYVIEANKPVTIRAGFQDVSNVYISNTIKYSKSGLRCSRTNTFVPIAGADYEIAFSWSDGNCDLRMNRISQKDGVAILKPVEVYEYMSCNNKDD